MVRQSKNAHQDKWVYLFSLALTISDTIIS